MALMLDEEMDENVTTIKVIGVGGGGGRKRLCSICTAKCEKPLALSC